MRQTFFFLAVVAALAACGSGKGNPDGGGEGGGAGGGGGDAGAVWDVSLHANVYAAASTLIGTSSVNDTGSTERIKLGTRTFHSVQSAGGSSAESTLALTMDENQLTMVATMTATQAMASGVIRDVSVCVTAPGATKVRTTYACSATPEYSVKGIASLSVDKGNSICLISKTNEAPPKDTRGTLVQESNVVDGKACYSSSLTFSFAATGGTGGSASLNATASMRFDPVY